MSYTNKNNRIIRAVVYESLMFVLAMAITWAFLKDFGDSLLLVILITIVKIPLFYYYTKYWDTYMQWLKKTIRKE